MHRHSHWLCLVVCLLASPVAASGQRSASDALSNPKIKELLRQINLKLESHAYKKNTAANLNTDIDDNMSEQIQRIQAGEELLLSIHVDRYYLADAFGYKTHQGTMFSLTDIFEILDFYIEVDVEHHLVKGWFISPERNFELMLPAEGEQIIHVTSNKRKFELRADQIKVKGKDIFVEYQYLEQWFGLRFDINYADLIATVTSTSPLPIQAQAARRNRQTATVSASQTAVLPWKESSYQALSAPLVDVQLRGSITTDDEYGSYSLLGRHDFAYLTTEYFVGGTSQNSLSDLRLNVSKESQEADLLGLLKVSRFELGDITPVNSGGGNTAGLSRGIKLSNIPLMSEKNNKTIDFKGDIQPGWDIELYRNGILIRQAYSLQDGRYDFNDVELIFGDNQFKLIFYGPQGQVKTETKQVYVDSNALKKHESNYQASITQLNSTLFNINSIDAGAAQDWLFSGVYQTGITDWLSLDFGHSSLFSSPNRLQTYSAGANLSIYDKLLVRADVDWYSDDSLNANMSLRTRWADQSYSLRLKHARSYSYLDNSISALHPNGQREVELDKAFDTGELRDVLQANQFNFSMSGFTDLFDNQQLSYSNSWVKSWDNRGNDYDQLSNQLAFNASRYTMSNTLVWRSNSINLEFDSNLFGHFQLQKSFANVFTRINASYNFGDRFEFTELKTQFSIPIYDGVESEIDFIYSPIDDSYRSSVGLNYHNDLFSLTTNIDYNSYGDWSVGLYSRFSFGYLPDSNDFIMSRRSLANQGSLVVRVFEDHNLNGIFDDGEQILEGAKVKGVQSYRQARTNADGIAILSSLPNNITTDIVLDRDSFSDPFLLPAIPGISITPRAGFVETLDFPVVQASELEGTIYISDETGAEAPAAYVTINLYDKNDKLIASTEAEFDGYYLFTDLLPGEYTAKIDPAYVKRKKLHSPDDMLLSFGATGEVVNGADFTLKELTFTKGYVVQLGEFASLDLLKMYWELMNGYGIKNEVRQAFYIQNKHTKKYALNIAFYKTKARARTNCNRFKQTGLDCEVEAFEFES